MAPFRMCDRCQAEYVDPLNRRFHAQPNACPVCGPKVWLEDGLGPMRPCGDPISETAALLEQGAIVALKGLGGFQLACDAANTDAVRALRERKRRPDKPFALMMRDMEEVRRHCSADEEESRLLRGPEAPIVLLRRKDGSSASPLVAPGNRYLGVMLPYTPIHHLLLADFGRPLVMTSGNLSEEPIAKDNEEARLRLGGLADYFLVHNRDIHSRYDDSVSRVRDRRAEKRSGGRGAMPRTR